MKRLLSLLLVLCLVCTALPAASAQSEDTEEAHTYRINGIDVRFDDAKSQPGECLAYALDIYNIIWGTEFSTRRDIDDNYLRELEVSELTLTEEHLKEYVSMAALGSCIRVCHRSEVNSHDVKGHSQIIVGKDENGFTVLEGGLAAYPHCREHYYTWHEYVSTGWLGGTYEYIKYIKCPNTPSHSEVCDFDAEFTVMCPTKSVMAEPWDSSVQLRVAQSGLKVRVVGYVYNSFDALWYLTDKGDYISAPYLRTDTYDSQLPSGYCRAELKVDCVSKPVLSGMSHSAVAEGMYFEGDCVAIAGYAYDQTGKLWLVNDDGLFISTGGLSAPTEADIEALAQVGITAIALQEDDSSLGQQLRSIYNGLSYLVAKYIDFVF